MSSGTAPHAVSSASAAEKYLTFRVADQHYGIRVAETREIITQGSIVSVPNLPPGMRGVINLRGRIIPVMDLRIHLTQASPEGLKNGCVIVVRPGTNGALIGLIVDEVEDVLNVPASDIQARPPLFNGSNTDFIAGMANIRGTVKLLIDLARLVPQHEPALA